MDRTRRPTPDHTDQVRHHLEILDRLQAVRAGLDAILQGHWVADEAMIGGLAELLASAGTHARALTLVRKTIAP